MFIEFGGKVLMGINRKVTKTKTLPITDMASLEKALSL
jgi:[acyl-carrier-protein] S-malonyltransferase